MAPTPGHVPPPPSPPNNKKHLDRGEAQIPGHIEVTDDENSGETIPESYKEVAALAVTANHR